MAGTIGVIDYGMGNLHSVVKALQRVSPDSKVSLLTDPEQLDAADRIVLPGVGAIRDCMAEIRHLCFDEAIRNWLPLGRPMLGVCVGMQVLLDHSDENGGVEGMGLIPGRLHKFPARMLEKGLKIPHMGWSAVSQLVQSDEMAAHPLFEGIADGTRFYFVHSYYADVNETEAVCATASYEVDVTAALARDNIFATQFHPEKSHDAGLKLLQNFSRWSC
ncbi:imidazole glycerol phosphate synthase subunit HisH [Allohahella sp. A8]|uniref:imidazole glycerol phosphate synthase subunit HisH n=1 Tax=Allohahella sp. A8 TaxID=3141461 RepID=UPI000C0909B1|nr:imidazole glycerol phosphate synthase subunit HisH [Hahellaceae bacterium]|tara:strand:- start:19975 stop:20628 length:654 start_codon:yes stop_codon:yes gene_type:complete